MIDKEEARRFAKERDANFEKARDSASAAFGKEFKPEAVLAAPDQYLKLLFVKLGAKIVKEMMPKAKETGKEHAAKLGSAKTKRPEV